MSYPPGSNDPPSYDEIVDTQFSSNYSQSEKQQHPFPSPSSSGGQGLVDTLTSVRSKHIRSVVDSEIYPLISDRASQGLSKSTLALIPSNVVSSTNSHEPGSTEESLSPEIIGLANDDDEEVVEIRLQGNLNRFEFWKQPDVVKELRIVLKDRLAGSSRLLDELLPLPPPQSQHQHFNLVEEFEPSPEAPSKLRGFFGRSKSSASSRSNLAQQQAPPPPPAVVQQGRSEMVDLRVDLEEICLRTVSDFGLYETINRPVVVVRIDARC